MRDYGKCSVDELHLAIETLFNLLEVGQAPVHIIHDNRDVVEYPFSLQSLKTLTQPHPNTGYLLLLPRDKATQFITMTLSWIAKQAIKVFDSVDSICAFLSSADPSINPIQFQTAIHVVFAAQAIS
jgi:hypothetical protein